MDIELIKTIAMVYFGIGLTISAVACILLGIQGSTLNKNSLKEFGNVVLIWPYVILNLFGMLIGKLLGIIK